MAIDTEHPEYIKRKTQWEKLRDCVEGQETVHSKGKKYLPGLSGQETADYNAYKQRATFYGATSRTVDGLSGMVFRKAPIIEVPEGLNPLVEDVTLDGLALVDFAEQLIDDDIVVGRAGILVDHPITMANTTKAQAEATNIRPFLKHYTAEQIFNWKTESRNNAQIVTHVRLWEFVDVPGDDEFESEQVKQIRVLDLNELGQYRQRVFQLNKKKEWVQVGDDMIPLKGAKPLDFVPFFFVGVKNGSPTCEKPPLIDMANVNLSHYITTADLEHGAHFTGLPTAVITGHQDDDPEKPAEYRIGAATAWVFPNPETEAFYLEFQGSGLESLEKRLTKKEEYMAFLGARMLSPDKKGVEAAETAQIHRAGEMSVLASLTNSCARSLEQAVQFMAEWAGINGDVSIKLNTDFMAIKMSAQDLMALFQTYQGGGMAFSDFLFNLKRGEIIQEDREEDDVRSEIETSNPFNALDMVPGGDNG